MISTPRVALLDYGAGNIRSAARALEKAGAEVFLTADPHQALEAEGLVVPGVGAYEACMKNLRAIHGPRIIGQRLAGGRPVLGICVGMQVLFDAGTEHGVTTEGCGQWPGVVEKLQTRILPHMGWNIVEGIAESEMFAGIDPETRFYFVHSYAARTWELETDGLTRAPEVFLGAARRMTALWLQWTTVPSGRHNSTPKSRARQARSSCATGLADCKSGVDPTVSDVWPVTSM